MTTPTTNEPTAMTTDTNKVNTPGVHAVMKNGTTGEIVTLFAKTRTELAKELQKYPNFDIIRVYKGKELNIKEKVSFSFN